MTNFLEIQKNASDQLNSWLRNNCNATIADPEEIQKRFNGKFGKSWNIPGDPPLILLLTKEFPYEPPRIALRDTKMCLEWPHVEKDGLLCVFQPNTNIRSDAPQLVTQELLNRAKNLIEKNSTLDVDAEFRTEFYSYWSISAENKNSYRSIVESGGPTRKIAIWRPENNARSHRIFGETCLAIDNWLSNFRIKATIDKGKQEEALLIWLDAPLVPKQYPNNAKDVYGLLPETLKSDVDIIKLFVRDLDLDVLIGASTATGNCYGAVCLGYPDYRKAQNGFRKGKMPLNHQKRFATTHIRQLNKGTVERLDCSWVHGRDQNEEAQILAETKVIIIGCGALGASVAVLLAKAGVGSFHFIDGETLERPNTSRHPLGAEKVGQNKATALSTQLKQRFPHLKLVTSTEDIVSASNISNFDDMGSADLVISATGVWSSMSLIADAADDWTTPLQTIWQEPRALAVHSVITLAFSSSLRSGFSPCGEPKFEITSQEAKDEWRSIPACGGMFTPYGATDLAFTSGFCAAESLKVLKATPARSFHAIWVASEERLKSDNAQYSNDFREKFNPSPQGGAYYRAWTAPES